MMRKYWLLLSLCLIPVLSVNPCTTFVLKTSNGVYFGRNLDWISDMGLMIINKRGITKQSLVFAPEKSIGWTSKYGSITFNQFGKEFPFGGINEKGLVIEIMISEAEYPEVDKRPVVNELQWIQYQLDNCATVAEVIATDSLLRIGQTHELLHYLITDANGNTAVVEFIGGKMVSYTDKELPICVLENEPYANSMDNFKNDETCRFNTAANLIKNYKGNSSSSAIDYSFKILQEVALSAEWSVVYDINNRQVHFKTSTNQDIRIVDMKSFDFSCTSGVWSYDLTGTHKGEVNKQFVKLNIGANTELLKKAMEINVVNLEPAQSNQLANYFKECICEK